MEGMAGRPELALNVALGLSRSSLAAQPISV